MHSLLRVARAALQGCSLGQQGPRCGSLGEWRAGLEGRNKATVRQKDRWNNVAQGLPPWGTSLDNPGWTVDSFSALPGACWCLHVSLERNSNDEHPLSEVVIRMQLTLRQSTLLARWRSPCHPQSEHLTCCSSSMEATTPGGWVRSRFGSTGRRSSGHSSAAAKLDWRHSRQKRCLHGEIMSGS